MANDILVLADHVGGVLSDATLELVGKAKELAAATGGQAVVALLGAPGLADQVGGADAVLTVDHPALSNYTPEAWEKTLLGIVNDRQPRLVLIANSTIGMDLGAALSAGWNAPLVAYAVGLEADGDDVVATAQVYGGKLLAEVALSGDRGVCTVVAGSFPAAGAGAGSPAVEAVTPPAGLDNLQTSFLTMIEPEAGDVDITAADALVSVGRGIGSQDNMELVQELADAIGAPLSASRPVTDLGWLPKTRQVGKSGLKVKPKVYLTFGISGAPEHLEGMRDAELIIACNTDAAAPIFDVAHYGTTVDLFDLVPALTDKLG
ncbi:MAG TPA: electron transfer flavoprotein subunit alpha/FixB family protein [Acidimicrobiia bacterium]|jgi:electron transfer flavoprotein alpha subunit|nr:electron transfer flavoprotein subunit alpha/FixB family protein [Acidimicrobiia bacterium]